MWWLHLIIELVTVGNSCAKNSKYQNNHIKVMTIKLLGSFFVDTMYIVPQYTMFLGHITTAAGTSIKSI